MIAGTNFEVGQTFMVDPNGATIEVPNEANATPSGEAAPAAPQPSLEDYAAHEYRSLLPKFKDQINKLSGMQAKKIVVALMEYPLEKIDFEWAYPEAQRAFVTGATIMDCRFVLMKAVIELTADQKRDILIEAKKAEEGEKQ
jgi:hypothetical protein